MNKENKFKSILKINKESFKYPSKKWIKKIGAKPSRGDIKEWLIVKAEDNNYYGIEELIMKSIKYIEEKITPLN